MKNRIACTLGAASLLMVTGANLSAAQAKAHYNEDRNVAADRQNREVKAYEFSKASDLTGKSVVNPNGETIASVQDFIADRGDGRLTHVLIKSGAVLGIGGKTVAVPYERLSYNAADKKFTLDMTKEQISRAAEFVPENWADLQHITWTEKMDRWFNGEQTADEAKTAAEVEDAYADSIRNGKTNEIRGTISRVERTRNPAGWEEVTLTVDDKNGQQQTLVLGPSWYVMSQDAAPMRGQTIDARAVPMTRDNQNRQVVLSADVNGKNLNLRNDKGAGRWNVTTDEQRSDAEQGRGRLVLVSDVLDAKVKARGDEDAGKVHDALIERHSGQIAALGLDPNDNFLGIGDEIKVVPWQLVSVTPSGDVRIDADKDMIKTGQTMPDDVTVYGTPARLEPVYAAYRIDAYTFEPRDADRRDASRRDAHMPQDAHAGTGAWSNDSPLLKQFKNGERASYTGKVKSIQTTSIDPTAPDAKVIVISTDDGERRIVIGPTWYIDRQNLALREGDRVTVTGKKAVINGTEYTAAWKLECPKSTVTLWEGDNAMWNGGR